jgi:hypothetical protein
MSSTESNSTEPDETDVRSGPWRSSLALVLGTIGLLAALVVALRPSRPRLAPAPLRSISAGCFKGSPDFTPTNLTEIPGLPLDSWGQQEKNRTLLRLNMEPCSCGCQLSIASCRASNPRCESSEAGAAQIAAEEKPAAAEVPARLHHSGGRPNAEVSR